MTASVVGYAAVMLGFTLALRFIGEAHVLTTIALYLPRWPLGLPLPFILAAVARGWRRRRWVAVLVALTAWCWLFPLLGLRLGFARSATPGRRVLRVLSFNVHANNRSPALLAGLRAAKADLLVLQECDDDDASYWKGQLTDYDWKVRDQFALGSRFPIAEVSQAFQQRAAYVKYRVDLPEGPVHVYSLHPPSPRLTMSELLAEETALDPARLARVSTHIGANAQDRARQLRVITADARASTLPVIIAGDTNLPDLSPVLARTFVDFDDSFREVGRGFGYTFPTGKRKFRPWMRLDRIFVNRSFKVLDFVTLPAAGSDHLPVLATVEL